MKKKIWMGSTKCDVCGSGDLNVIYDARTRMGCWATLCDSCYKRYGVGLETGNGQKYIKNSKNQFEKVEG